MTQQIGNIALFVADSEDQEPDGHSATSTQANWIKNQMLASTAFCGGWAAVEAVRLHAAGSSLAPAGTNIPWGAVLYLGVAPFIFRFSRVIWLQLDWVLDPADTGDAPLG